MSQIDLIEPEDELPDYSQLSVPKRGEKEFQPDGTTIQQSALQTSLEAMYSALDSLRMHHIKQKLIGIWRTDDNCCYVPHPRGSHFKDMGVPSGKKGGVVLNAIECLYLVERGSMVVYLGDGNKSEEDIENTGLALNLSYLYALAKVDLAQYQIYSYLKRLGYIIQPHTSKTDHIPLSEPIKQTKMKPNYLVGLARNWGILSYPSFHPMHFKTKHYFNYTDIFKSLSLNTESIPTTTGNLKITFRVWKPTPSFSKKSPPSPDFHVVVLDTSTDTKFPSFADVQALHDEISSTNIKPKEQVKPTPKKKSSMPPSKKELRAKRQAERQSKLDQSVQKRNVYLNSRDQHLKNGSVTVVIAIVNQGIINFVNLSRGNFKLKECDNLDNVFPNKIHSIIYNEF